MNRWTMLRLERGLGAHAQAWDALYRRLVNPNPLLESRFIDSLLRHFGDGTEHLCIFRSGGVPQAMCVLKPRTAGVWASFLPAQAQIGPALLDRPELIPQLLRALPGINGQLDWLCSDPDYGGSSGIPLEKDVTAMQHARTISIRLSGGFANYWSTRPKKLVQNIGRYTRRSEACEISSKLVRITEPQELINAVTRYANLESKGWKAEVGTAVTPDGVQAHFYTELVQRFGQTDQACIHELWFGDQLAASRITITAGNTVVMLKTTYDESLEKYAPGRILLKAAIEYAFTTYPGGLIEFYTNAGVDMLAWGTADRWIRHQTYFRGSVTTRLFRAAGGASRLLRLPAAVKAKRSLLVSAFRHPDELPEDVRQLFDTAEKQDMELSLAWFRNLVDTVYAQHDGVFIYVLRRAGRVVAALPVLYDWSNKAWCLQSLSNYYSAIYAPVATAEVTAHELALMLLEIRRRHPKLGSMRFAPMYQLSHTYGLLHRALKIAGFLPFEYFCFGNWFMREGVEWPDYLRARSGLLRSTIKRMGKRFSVDGGTLELVCGGDRLDAAIAAYERVYAASWKIPEPHPKFVPGLIRLCAEKGWLRLGVAWLKDEPIAVQLWIVASAKANIYKLAYHESFKTYAPGTLLTAMLMQHVMEQDHVAEIDYLIGDDPYKQTWMTERRERWGIIAYNIRTFRGLVGMASELGGRTAKYLVTRLGRQARTTRPNNIATN